MTTNMHIVKIGVLEQTFYIVGKDLAKLTQVGLDWFAGCCGLDEVGPWENELEILAILEEKEKDYYPEGSVVNHTDRGSGDPGQPTFRDCNGDLHFDIRCFFEVDEVKDPEEIAAVLEDAKEEYMGFELHTRFVSSGN